MILAEIYRLGQLCGLCDECKVKWGVPKRRFQKWEWPRNTIFRVSDTIAGFSVGKGIADNCAEVGTLKFREHRGELGSAEENIESKKSVGDIEEGNVISQHSEDKEKSAKNLKPRIKERIAI